MGFLDSSTNNIVLDAVLTDAGRKALARNDGSFSIVKFALSDDDVSYGIITKYGRTVGREKIEKNTPVLEASTNAQHALKYKLVSVSNPYLIRMPTLSLSGDSNVDGQNSVIRLGRNAQKSATFTIEQVIQNETSIDVELRDQTFVVDVPNMFFQLARNTPANIDNQQRATYIVTRSPTENAFGGSTLQLTISSKSVPDSSFTVFGMGTQRTMIKSYVRVSGMQSGAVIDVAVYLSKDL